MTFGVTSVAILLVQKRHKKQAQANRLRIGDRREARMTDSGVDVGREGAVLAETPGASVSSFVGLVSPLSEHYKGREVRVFEFSPELGKSATEKQGFVVEVYLSKFAGANGNTSMCLIKFLDQTEELIDLRQGRVFPLGGAPIPAEPFRNVWFTPAPEKEPPPPKSQYYYTTPFKLKSLFDCILCDYFRFAFGKSAEPPIAPDERVRLKKVRKKQSTQMIWPWEI